MSKLHLLLATLMLGSHYSAESLSLEPIDKYDWWQNEVFYQIYPRSFMDSDGDGIGDLKGITSKLQYLADTGITATWLSPIFQSPMVDFGYDISDYTKIQPEYGTLEDLDELIAEATRLGIKIILDFVPNHSSDQHEWFKKSVAREPGYEDFYVWEDGKVSENDTRTPPNNWVSVFDGSAWQWNDERQQYYLRQFTAAQPDLNYRNPKVIEAMDDILIYWLDRGVSGFRIDAIIYIYEDAELRDEPLSGTTDNPNSVNYLSHIYTRSHPDDVKIIQHWRQLLDDYSAKNTGVQRIMMTEGYADLLQVLDYYEDSNGVQGAQIPFNFYFITDINAQSDARDFVYFIEKWLIYMPHGHIPNWVMGNHDNPRIGSRFGKERIDAMNMIMMTLPGVGVTYYGEEIGMVDYRDISWEDTVDEPACEAGIENYKTVSRDPVRTPFQWDSSPNAGFSNASKTWLPVHPNYLSLNLKAQKSALRSHYKVYKALLALRSQTVLRKGAFIAEAVSRQVLAFKRELKGQFSIITIVNISGDQQVVDVSDFIDLPNALILQVVGVDSDYKIGQIIQPTDITLAPYEGIVAKLLIIEL